MKNDKMRLGAFLLQAGHHVAGWRHPSANPRAGLTLQTSIRMAQALERAKFDLIFFADGVSLRDPGVSEIAYTSRATHFEAITHAAALSAVTSRIGFISTASTSFHAPYNIARQFGSLDHLNGGRTGWNVVTSGSDLEAANYGMERMPQHDDRYAVAEECVDVVLGLWNTWGLDALRVDQASGVFFDASQVRLLNHKGEHFNVRGPLNMARSPQGQPLLVQAGSSPAGRNLGARTSEIIFTATPTLKEAQELYGDVKERVQGFGRAADDVKIMPGFSPVVGRTESEARAKYEELQQLIHPVAGMFLLAHVLGTDDIMKYDVDGPIPELPKTNEMQSRQTLALDMARRDGLTIRQLYMRVAGARGHTQVIGTPAQIVDEMEERFRGQGADGFNIMPATLPGGVDDFIELVVPELQRRNLFRTEYEGDTLRANLGTRPPTVSSTGRPFSSAPAKSANAVSP